MGDASPPRDARHWQGPNARRKTGRAPARSRAPLVLGLLFSILALGGALVALVFYLRLPPEPLLVVIRIDQYRDDLLPVSPFGEQDREALRGARRAGLREQDAFNSQDRDRLLEELKNLGHRQKPDQPLVVYLSAYAVGTADGGVAVLPADAHLDDPASWVSFNEVLDALEKCPVKRRLLLLDLTQPCTTARGGLLANDVAERLHAILEKAVPRIPNLQVLMACSPGQVSLSSEELGTSVFAHFVAKGLLGHADGCLPNQPANHEVGVQELQSYVKTQVERWAWHNRKAWQTPVFFGPAADYALTRPAEPASPEPAAVAREYPAFLQRPWKERDGWWKDLTSATPPALYRQLEGAALRAEQRWRGGEPESKVKAWLDPRVDELLARRRDEKVGGDGGEPRSLAQMVAAGQAAPALTPDAQREFKELAALFVLTRRPMPNDKDVMRFAKDREALVKKYDGRPFDLAWTVFAAAVAENAPQQDHLRCWYGLLQPEGQPPPAFSEARFLKRLIDDLKPEKPADWPAVADALRLTAEAEAVEARNPRLQPWLKTRYAEAVRKRAAAEELLFSQDARQRAAAPKAIGDALERFSSVGKELRTLTDAQRYRDEALVFLPAYVPYLELDAAEEKTWEEAVRATRELDDVLAAPSAEAVPDALRRISELVATLSNNLSRLRKPLDSPWVKKPFDERLAGSGTDAVLLSVLLQLPGPSAADRMTLWNNYRIVADRLNREAAEREKSSEPPPGFDGAVAVRHERDRALLRAQTSLALLKLAKAADADKVEAELQKVTRAPTDEAAWLALARALRGAWKQHDIDRARSLKN